VCDVASVPGVASGGSCALQSAPSGGPAWSVLGLGLPGSAGQGQLAGWLADCRPWRSLPSSASEWTTASCSQQAVLVGLPLQQPAWSSGSCIVPLVCCWGVEAGWVTCTCWAFMCWVSSCRCISMSTTFPVPPVVCCDAESVVSQGWVQAPCSAPFCAAERARRLHLLWGFSPADAVATPSALPVLCGSAWCVCGGGNQSAVRRHASAAASRCSS
jgi:hypothetical protein